MARILIVDDDELIRYTLRKLLESKGHSPIEAENGLEAIRVLRSKVCDVMIVDIFMPKKDGLETLREAFRVQPGIKTIAISGQGGYDDNSHLDRALHFGADGVLAKPFELKKFVLFVEKLIGSNYNDA